MKCTRCTEVELHDETIGLCVSCTHDLLTLAQKSRIRKATAPKKVTLPPSGYIKPDEVCNHLRQIRLNEFRTKLEKLDKKCPTLYIEIANFICSK